MSYSNKDIVASVFEAVNTVIRAAEVAKKQTKQGYHHSAWKNDTKRLTQLALCKETSRRPAKDRQSGRFNALFTLKFSVSASKTLDFENPIRSGHADCRFVVDLTKIIARSGDLLLTFVDPLFLIW